MVHPERGAADAPSCEKQTPFAALPVETRLNHCEQLSKAFSPPPQNFAKKKGYGLAIAFLRKKNTFTK